MTIRWTTLCLDCADALQLADFYSGLLGWPISARDGDSWLQLRDPEGGVGLNIQAEPWYRPPLWPEGDGEQHKMMHFELLVDDDATVDAAVARAISLGARQASPQPMDRNPRTLRVMLDPAGHPFCLFVHGE